MMPLPDLELSKSREEEVGLIEDFIRRQVGPAGPIRILEAGCGRRWPLLLEGVDYHLTGVDSDPDALKIRKNVSKDLDEIVEGDLRTIQLPAAEFDVVYNSFVLEHIQGAEGVLQSFLKWVKPGGLIVLRIPDPASVQGWVTRITPHWFHIFHYRFILRLPHAGEPGFPPYPTYYDPVVSRQGLRAFCQQHGLTIEAERGDGFYRPGFGSAQRFIDLVKRIIGKLSLGAFSDKHTNLLYVLRTKG
jgi:SAM-dependent methyltransferase